MWIPLPGMNRHADVLFIESTHLYDHPFDFFLDLTILIPKNIGQKKLKKCSTMAAVVGFVTMVISRSLWPSADN